MFVQLWLVETERLQTWPVHHTTNNYINYLIAANKSYYKTSYITITISDVAIGFKFDEGITLKGSVVPKALYIVNEYF